MYNHYCFFLHFSANLMSFAGFPIATKGRKNLVGTFHVL
jgi:hypothetical protein